MTRPKGVMSWSIFSSVINQCKQLDVSQLTLFLHKEGEPLLDKLLIRRIQHVKQELPNLGELGINTNGMLLSGEIAKQLLTSGLDTLFVSIDGNSPQTYNKLRAKLDFDTVSSNLDFFIEMKRSLDSKLRIIVQMAACQKNKHEIDSFKSRWEDKVDEVYIKSMHSYLDGGSSSISSRVSKDQRSSCFDPFNIIVVFWNGDCGVCCWDYDNIIKTKNVKEASLLEIFNGETFNLVRKAHSEKRCDTLVPCNRCLRVFGDDQICDVESSNKSME